MKMVSGFERGGCRSAVDFLPLFGCLNCKFFKLTKLESPKEALESLSSLQQRQLLRGDDPQSNCMLLLHQREEENRQEILKLTAEIKSLKLKLLQQENKLQGKVVVGGSKAGLMEATISWSLSL